MSKFKAYNGKDLPFSIYSSSVLTGYQEYVSGTFSPNVSFEGIQDDNYNHIYLEGNIQGTYSEQNVGGRKNHHIELSSSFSRSNRSERYELTMYTGTLIINPPTVGLPADRSFREPLTKRTFGFKNILEQNYNNNYEVVSTSGRSINNRDFYHSGGYDRAWEVYYPFFPYSLNDQGFVIVHDGNSYFWTIPNRTYQSIDDLVSVIYSSEDNSGVYGFSDFLGVGLYKNELQFYPKNTLYIDVTGDYLEELRFSSSLASILKLNTFYDISITTLITNNNPYLTKVNELPFANYNFNYKIPQRTKRNKTSISTRFNHNTKKLGSGDYESAEYSAYSVQPWKDWFARKLNNHINSKVFIQGYNPEIDSNYFREYNYSKLVNFVNHKVNSNTQWSSKNSYLNHNDSNYNGPMVVFCVYNKNFEIVPTVYTDEYFFFDSHINKFYYCSDDSDDFAYNMTLTLSSLASSIDTPSNQNYVSSYIDDYNEDSMNSEIPNITSFGYRHNTNQRTIEGNFLSKNISQNISKITNRAITSFYLDQLAPISDNHYITHQIPQNDIQYWWQHKSLNHSASYYGYFNKENPGVYQTSSELQQQLWSLTGDNLNTYNTTFGNEYVSKDATSFSNFSPFIKDKLDIETNILGYGYLENISSYRFIQYPEVVGMSTIPVQQLRFLERSYISSNQKLASNYVKGCPEFFAVLLQYRNGIYGWPSWKQYKTENILTRYQRNNNYINNRNIVFREPALSYNKKCTNIIDKNVVSYTYSNNKEHFSNEILERYSTNKQINKTIFDIVSDKNLSIKNIKYSELLYPDKLNVTLKNIRIRDNFLEWWKNNRNDRNTLENPVEVKTVDGGITSYYSPIWNLDERIEGKTNLYSGSVTYGELDYYTSGRLQFPNSIFYNPLANYNVAPDGRGVGWGKTPIYARPTHSGSVANNSYYGEDAVIFYDTKWETAKQSGRQPYYQTYEEYLEDIKPLTQNKSLLPEFRISEHIDYYLENGGDFFIKNDNFLSVNQSSVSSSAQDSFYDIYSLSRSDSKNLELIKNKKVTKIELNCEGLIKFLPHKGFYPAERTVQCVDYFSGSYTFESTSLVTSDIFDRPVYTTLFSPGILYNTIKSGIAVDYPKATYNIAITGSNGKSLSNSDDSIDEGFPRIKLTEDPDAFVNRFPFESLLEPENYIDYTLDIEASPMSRMTGNYCKNLKNISPIYQMSIHNFLAESINLFMKNGELSAFASKPQQKIVVDSSKKEYIMTLKMYSKPWETYEDYGITFVKPNFLMFSSGSAFGVPSDISDTYLHYHNYSCFTPPYFDHPNGAEIAFVFVPWKTSSNEYTLQEIVSNLKIIGNGDRNGSYYFVRNSRVSSDTPDVPYHYGSDYSRELNLRIDSVQSPIQQPQNWMQITSSINYNIVENVKNVNYEALSGIPIDVQDNIDKQTWIIQTKFETPILNFYNCSVDGSHINTSSYSEMCVGALNKGMWLQYSRKLEDNEGVYLKIQDVVSDYQSSYIHDNINTGSLADLVGFDKKEIRLGEVDNSKFIREAIVAVPYILDGNDKKFFYIRDIDIDKILNDDPRVSVNLRNTAKSMKKYVFPPRYDWNMNKYKVGRKSGIDIVRPFKMFVFEFEREFSSQDLLDIWQNVMPESYRDFQIQNRKIEIDVEEHPDILSQLDKVKWMIFKVKQKAEKNYYAKTANSSDDSRFSFELKYGNKGRKNFVPEYSYNWPYDWMSLVEFANVEMTVEAEEEPPNIPQNLRIQ